MAFNVGNFVKSQAKSAVERLVSGVVGNVVSGLPRNSQLVASSTAQSLLNVGASYKSVSAFSASKVDSVVSGGDPHYAAATGKDVAKRASQPTVAAARNIGSDDLDTYIETLNPQTAIAAKKAKKSVEVLSAVI